MWYRNRLVLCAVALMVSHGARAGETPLLAQISSLFNRDQTSGITRSVTLLTPEKQLAGLCDNPTLSLSGSDKRLAGNRSVIARCGAQRRFIQVRINAHGKWWTPNRTIRAGEAIQAQDLQPQQGVMDSLPAELALNKADIVGRIATRVLSPGQPLVESQLRQRWKVRTGDHIELLATGEGFTIRTTGTALDNAALDQTLRIRTRSGQIVTGKAVSAGKATIYLAR
ncbi:flagellar basal body P-ring formation chaperone FlgA [Entomohabitans teleogrylli]|uniref:flagellar basal body P-ring formation chaperone FlgA n=1 Tax=Entomohabitans teleogrylli TaxID=1384589 RepID=UPI0008FCA72D|nr:flagellar basal body P-ring formation chaperone FlgA [Entomohabitans teleogrylli]